MVQLLINFGANVNEQEDDPNTALHISAQLTHTTLVHLLLDNEADPNTENIH